ncbi:FAD-dependent monooxygenase, partial [Listeria monocytogenes]|nr:FAD-dependent monooxygenase [Listeria monocytogenes]
YIIGADGARSLVAQNAGLPFEGQMGIGDSGSINIEFSAELSSLCEHRKGDMYWMFRAGSGINGVGVAALRMIRPWNKWMCVWGYEESKGTPEITKEEAKKIIHEIIGTDEI